MPKASPAVLAARNGATILRTEATKQYRLGSSDLDSILPVSVRPHGQNLRQEYNVVDVIALDARLNSALPHIWERATENGPQIHFIEAMKRFKLRPTQMYRIKPVSDAPNNSNRTGRPYGIYNLCDVERLSASVKAAASSPSPPAAPRSESPAAGSSAVASSSTNPVQSNFARRRTSATRARPRPVRHTIRIEVEDYYEEYNMFDGLSHDDAEALLYQVCRW
ncbi:hypothetical protein FB451DRAFT_1433822 [Mycena latifolia]|nr:hypothetical protein FB451DRAFT_1433822 [Mycena latifolia]